MKINCAKRILSLVLSLLMLVSMMSVLTVFGASAAAETTQIASLTPDEWDYTAEEGKFYFDSNKLYNYAYPTTVDGHAIVSKVAYNLGQQFTANYVIGAKTKTSNYPSDVDYGIAFRVGSDLEVLVWHDSKWGSIYTTATTTTKMVPKVKVTYKGVIIYEGEALKRADGTTKLATGVNNSMTKGTYSVHYENGMLSLTYTLWNAPYDYLYTVAEDGTKTNSINLADLVPDFNADQVIFNDKVSVSLICAGSNDVMSLESFSLSSVPAAPPSTVNNFIVTSFDESQGTVIADENNPAEVVAGDRLTYTAVANEGYRFAGWFNAAGTAVAATPTATFQIYEGTEIYAKFISNADHTQVAKPNRATILCLGDSITDGYCIASGYRSYLMKQLYAEGAYFDFSVGKYRDDDDNRLPVGYRNHGGLTGVGFKAYGSLKTAITYLDDSMGVANADIALVMLGTNDYSHYADASDYIGEYYREYLDKLYEQNPNLVVFVASVINQKTMATPAAASGALNEQLPEIVAEYKAAGKDITFVDMCNLSGLVSDDFADAVHPNESGAEKIADVWYNAIVDKVFEVNALGDDNYKAPEAVESVQIIGGEAINVYMQSTDRVQLRAVTLPLTAEMTTVNWQSSDDTIASIDNFGNVTALREGSVIITATAIDGGKTDSITLNVVDSTAPDADYVIFEDDFSSADNWTGDTAIINPASNNVFANYANATKTISTAEAFALDSFRLHFNYRVYGNNTGNHNGKYNELSFGGYALRFGDCVRIVDVYYDGTKLANIYTGAAITGENSYDLVYSNGAISVLMNGVVIYSADNAAAPVESAITYTANEPWRASYISDLYLTGVEAACEHANTELRDYVDATCTAEGYTGDTYCVDCGEKLADGVVIPALECVCEAIIGDAHYATLVEAIANAADGSEIILLADITVANGCEKAFVVDGKAITINLNGKTVTAGGCYGVFYVTNGATLTLEGDGNVVASMCEEGYAMAIFADGGNVIINGGNYSMINTGDDPTYDLIYVKNGGSLVINDGYFVDNTPAMTLNIHDGTRDTCSIVVNGGKFVGFNPSCNKAEGEHTNFAAEGLIGVESDGVYTLVEGTNEVEIPAVDATCTETGLTAGVKCGACGKILVAQEIVNALGHTEEVIPGKAATCIETGLTDGVKCSVCGVILTEQVEIPVTDHTYGEWVVDGVNKVQTKTCSTCGDVVTEAYQPADDEVIASGNWNDDGSITWSLTGNGVLTINGSGEMQEYAAGTSPVIELRKQIKTIVIGDGITYISNRAFKGMTGTKTVIFGKDVKSTGYEAFMNCLNLTTVELNEGLVSLGSLVFYGADIETIELPTTLETINNRVFKNCEKLTYIAIPDSVTYIGYEVFMGCTSLTGFKWSANVSYINSMMFNGCTSLKEVTIPTTVWSFRSNAFTNSGLTTLTFENGNYLLDNGAFASNTFNGIEKSSLTFKVQRGSKAHYYAVAKGYSFELI